MKIQAVANNLFAHITIDSDEDKFLYFASSIIYDETGEFIELRELIKMKKHCDIWISSFPNGLGWLDQDFCDIHGTDTICFIRRSAIPKGLTVIYSCICVNYCPQKLNPNRCRLILGGNRINYPWELSMPTYDLTTSNMIFNSIISTPGAIFLTMNIIILPWQSNETPWLHATSNLHSSVINHPTIQNEILGRKWFCLLLYYLRNVWLTSGWKTCQQPPPQASQKQLY